MFKCNMSQVLVQKPIVLQGRQPATIANSSQPLVGASIWVNEWYLSWKWGYVYTDKLIFQTQFSSNRIDATWLFSNRGTHVQAVFWFTSINLGIIWMCTTAVCQWSMEVWCHCQWNLRNYLCLKKGMWHNITWIFPWIMSMSRQIYCCNSRISAMD